MSHTSSYSPGESLARNTVYNIVGMALPMTVAIFTIPMLIKQLGTQRFGVLSLVWMVVGYFSFFDLGIGRAITKLVAEYISRDEKDLLPELIWTAIYLLFCIGLCLGGVTMILTPWMINNILNIPRGIADESQKAFYVLAASIPLIVCTAGTKGVLEAQHRFGLVNAIKIPASIAIFIAPMLVLPFSVSLYPIVILLVISRFVTFLLYLYFCLNSIPGLIYPCKPTTHRTRELISFGSWLSLTNAIGTAMSMGYIDRLIIGTLLSMSAVTYYVTPLEFVTKLWLIPGAFLSVLFPTFSAYAPNHRDKLAELHENALKYILFVLTPIVVAVIILPHPILSLWIGVDFADHSSLVLQLLVIGAMINSLAQVPFSAIQAMGRADLTAKRHLVELPFYVIITWLLIKYLGITGAALSWLLWTVVDTAILFWIIYGMFPTNWIESQKSKASVFLSLGFIFLLSFLLSNLSSTFVKLAGLLVILLVLAAIAWSKLVDDTEKKYIFDFAVQYKLKGIWV